MNPKWENDYYKRMKEINAHTELELSIYFKKINKNNSNEIKLIKTKLDEMEKKLIEKNNYRLKGLPQRYYEIIDEKIQIENENDPPMSNVYKRSPIYVPNKKIPVTDWIPKPKVKMKEIETNSWFKTFSFKNEAYGEIETKTIKIPIIPEESFKQQMKVINMTKKQVLKGGGKLKKPGFIYCEKVRLFPDEEQISILKRWFDACTEMYNVTVRYIQKRLFTDGVRDIDDTHKTLNFIKTRCALKDDRETIMNKYGKPFIYTHILDEAIKEVITNYKSCITNLKKDNIKKFYISERNKNRSKMIMKIEKDYFRNCTIARLGELKTHTNKDDSIEFDDDSGESNDDSSESNDDSIEFDDDSIEFDDDSSESNNDSSESKDDSVDPDDHPLSDKNITMCCTLQYDAITKKYILFVPKIKETSTIEKKQNACGIDLGVRSQATVYSEADIMEFGVNMGDNFKKQFDKIDSIKKKINEKANPLNSRGKISKALKRNNKKLKKLNKILGSEKKSPKRKILKKRITTLKSKNILLKGELDKIIPPKKTFNKDSIEKSLKKYSHKINSLMIDVESEDSSKWDKIIIAVKYTNKREKLKDIIKNNNEGLILMKEYSQEINLLTNKMINEDNLLKRTNINILIEEYTQKIEQLKNLHENKSNGIMYSKEKLRMRKGIRKYETQLTNKVKDIHYKVAHILVSNYNNIYLGKLNVKSILSKRNITISSYSKRVLQKSSPYLFGKRLIYMGYKYGSNVVKISEYLSTQTCSNCGNLNKMGSKKIYTCLCGMRSDRDVNSAKTHLKIGLST